MQPSGLPLIVVSGLAFEARIAAGDGIVTVCGGRPEQLAAAIVRAVAEGCQGIISFGIAGGLVSTLEPGACIVARSVVAKGRRFDSHPEWSRRLLQAIPGAIHADIAGVTAPVATPADKRAMARLTGAAAVDMESVHSVGAAVAYGLPFAAVRVVADPLYRALPPAALAALNSDGTPDFPAVFRSIVSRPQQIKALIRTALDARTARAGLMRARRLLGPGFSLLEIAEAMTPAE